MPTGRLTFTDSDGFPVCHPGTLTPVSRKATKAIFRRTERRRRNAIARASRKANRPS